MRTKEDVDRLVAEVGVPAASQRCGVAAILFTYRCSIACRHCCFACAGDRPDVVMTPRQCADRLALLHEIGRVIHIAGGEAMLYWPALAESVRLANAEGNGPHFIETNCSFAVDDDVVRERFAFLAEHGLKGILASADAFHQEHVPPERFLRVRRIAFEIFGEKNFYGSRAPDEKILALPEIVRDERRLREYVRGGPPNMVGAAQVKLSRYLDAFALDDPALPAKAWQGPIDSASCAGQFRAETIWELHIDPYDNIQTNCGMILGAIADTTPARILLAGPEHANRFIETVCAGGPRALADLARREYGFTPPDRVTQTCDLCYRTRRFLRRFHPEVFGPAEVYAG